MNATRASLKESRLAQLLYPAVLVLIFIAPAQFAYAVRPRHGPFITPADVLLVLLAIVWVLNLIRTRRFRQVRWAPQAAWALVAVAILSVTKAVDVKSALVEIGQIGVYFIVAFMLFVDILRHRHRVRTAVDVLAAATTIIVLWGLVEYLTEPDPMKVAASFGNRNVYCGYLTIVVPLLYGLSLHVAQRWRRWWWLGVVVVGVVTMLSGPLLWCVLGALIVISAGHNRPTLLKCLAAIAVFVALMPFVFPRNYAAALDELRNPYEEGEIYKVAAGADTGTGEEVKVVKKRWLEWQPALNMMADNLLLGVGAGNYQLCIGQYYGLLPNVRKTEADTNNLYLVIGGSLGLAGLVSLVALLAYFWRLASGLWLRVEDDWGRGLAAGLMGSIGTLVVANFFTSLLVRGTGLVMFFVFALVEVTARRRGMPSSGNN